MTGSVGSGGGSASAARPSVLKIISWLVVTVLGVVVSMIVGATKLQPFIDRNLSHAAWYYHHRNAKPDCKDHGYYSEINPVNSNAINYLPDHGKPTYRDDTTSDNNRRTGWVEYNFGQNGPNRDVINWDFSEKSHIRLICVRNGLTDTPYSMNDTGEVRLLHIDCGPDVISHTFADLNPVGMKWEIYQSLHVDCNAGAVVFLIKSIYTARDKSNTDQVAISDVQFYG